MAQRMHRAPIGGNSVFVSSPANQRPEAARGHLVAESAERVHSSCRKGGGGAGGVTMMMRNLNKGAGCYKGMANNLENQ
ncbi:hypothetical protein QQF64_013767 [Cirrhinus molitorella]